jgi:hypothetical protein
MPDLSERIRRTLDAHRAEGVGCRCGAKDVDDHPRHAAEQVVAQLHSDLTNLSASIDEELTILQGAQ